MSAETAETLKTPILFLIFNRPDLTRQVFARIREAQPAQLFISADGPRPDRPDDVALCAEARSIVDNVDWQCEVHTLFQEGNLGCRKAVSGAITWFFEHVEEGIILEDDCTPDPSFFEFCRQLLDTYRENPQVMSVAGSNVQRTGKSNSSYIASRIPEIWGWATWKDAWSLYDDAMADWPDRRATDWLAQEWGHPKIVEYWTAIFDKVYADLVNSWGYRWTYSVWKANGLCLIPNQNLVSNIGFGPDATHTTHAESPLSQVAISPLNFPLKPPKSLEPNPQFEKQRLHQVFGIDLRPAPIQILNRIIQRGPGRLKRELKKLSSIRPQ